MNEITARMSENERKDFPDIVETTSLKGLMKLYPKSSSDKKKAIEHRCWELLEDVTLLEGIDKAYDEYASAFEHLIDARCFELLQLSTDVNKLKEERSREDISEWLGGLISARILELQPQGCAAVR